MSENLKAHTLVFIVTILIAFSFIVSGKLSGLIDPISLTLLRFVFAFIVLLPFILLIKVYREKIKQSFFKGLKISLFYSLYFILLFKSLETTSALNTATLFTLVPLVTAVFANFVFHNKLNFLKLFIYIIGMIGTIIVIFDGSMDAIISLSFNKGDILFLFAVLSMAIYSISAKYFYEKDDNALVITLTTLFGGIIWMSLALLIFDIPLEWTKIQGENLWYMLYLSIGATLMTVFLCQKATVTIGPNNVMAYVYFNPAIVAFIMYIFEGQSINIVVSIGILISFFATLFLLKLSKNRL
ncbi:MAG: DMT family transporter [Aliarcobacter sp.]|nr:DMT family transporter [Aliarcobacter sp.]